MKYQCSSGGHWLSYFHFPGGRQGCTQGTEPSAPTSSMDCGFNLEPAIKPRAPMKQQRALPTSGHQCPQQQKVHQVCCHYQVCLITAITGSQGRAARHLLFKGKKAAQGSTEHSSNCKYFTICRVIGVKQQFWKCSFIPAWPHHAHKHLRWPYCHGIHSVSIPAVWSTGHTR